jgi:hypothetical protein
VIKVKFFLEGTTRRWGMRGSEGRRRENCLWRMRGKGIEEI